LFVLPGGREPLFGFDSSAGKPMRTAAGSP